MEDLNKKEQFERSDTVQPLDEAEQEKFNKTFSKSNKNKVLFGVCGGIADYLNIQPAIVRIIFSLGIFIGGWGIIFYLIAAFTMPSSSDAEVLTEKERSLKLNEEIKIIVSVLVIFIGLYEVLNAYNFWLLMSVLGFSPNYYVPVIILAAGISIVVKSFQMHEITQEENDRKFYRSSTDKSLFGVAGGLAKYFNISSVFMRTLLMLIFFLTGGIITIAYLAMSFTVPKEGQLS